MKILILNWRDIRNPKSGGAEIVTFEHAKAWVKAGHKVAWFTSKFKGSSKNELIEGIEIIRGGNALTVYLLAPFYYFFSRLRFDVVIDEIHALPFFTPLYVKVPKVVFIHEVAREIWNYMLPFPIGGIGRLLELLYFKLYKNQLFWTDAGSTIDELVKFGINRSSCIAIPCAIQNKVLEVLPNKENDPTFIFISRLVRMKGVEEVIRAFSIIKKEKKDAQLWILGGGDENYVSYLHNITKDLGVDKEVKFFGYVTEKKKLELVRRAHILLHASVKEGWGLVVIEAASQGTPAVVYNVSGLRDSVINGKTGIVLTENSPKDLAKEAIFLMADKKRYVQFQNNCLKWAKSLKWDDITQDSLRLIESSIKNSRIKRVHKI